MYFNHSIRASFKEKKKKKNITSKSHLPHSDRLSPRMKVCLSIYLPAGIWLYLSTICLSTHLCLASMYHSICIAAVSICISKTYQGYTFLSIYYTYMYYVSASWARQDEMLRRPPTSSRHFYFILSWRVDMCFLTPKQWSILLLCVFIFFGELGTFYENQNIMVHS